MTRQEKSSLTSHGPEAVCGRCAIVSNEELVKVLKSFASNKVSVPDGLTNVALKATMPNDLFFAYCVASTKTPYALGSRENVQFEKILDWRDCKPRPVL